MLASQIGNTEVVRILLNYGAEVNAACDKGITPLMLAGQNGHTGVVRLLLDHGADVNAVLPKTETDGDTSALALSTLNGQQKIVRLLLEKGADRGVAAKGCLALFIAAKNGRWDIVRDLI